MAGKGFCVKIRLELHAITCPGVWLCPNGKVALRITSLGSTLESHRVSPIFPLLFHDEFNFKKTFTRLATLTELQRKLEQEFIYAELIQWLSPCNDQPIILATFETNLADVLYPVANYKGLLAGVDVDLLMDPSKYFPIESFVQGIIAPKIEISTRTVIEEVLGVCCTNVDRAYVVNPKTIDSKLRAQKTTRQRYHQAEKGLSQSSKNQQASNLPFVSTDSEVQRVSQTSIERKRFRSTRYESSNLENSYQGEEPRSNECYHPPRENSNRRCEFLATGKKNHRLSAVCDNLHIFDGCPVCSKYKCYFSCEREPIVDECKRNSLKDVETRQCFFADSPCYTPTKDDDFVSVTAQCSRDRYPLDPEGKPRGLDKNCRPNNISEYYDFHLQPRDEANHGFYTNLERFYKRMHKQARRRAQEANVF
nr:PREDICTED: uncharacterized protein LOC100882171 [Megachile rotundata]